MNSTLVTRWLPAGTLLLWSAVLLATHFSGKAAGMLHPMFRLGVPVAGVVLALIAAVIVFFPRKEGCCSDLECSHTLSRSTVGRILSLLVLALPISVAAVISPESFSAKLVANRGTVTDASSLGKGPKSGVEESAASPSDATAEAPPPATTTSDALNETPLPDYLKKTADGNVEIEVLDMLYAAQDQMLRKDFENRKIELIAQFMPDSSESKHPNRFKAVRMFMTCCASDARPVATFVEMDPIPALPEMTWVRIVGQATFPMENGKRQALIKGFKVEKTKPPEDTMLF
jgi:uncharacterized repeat protein (TIGR03943 family)